MNINELEYLIEGIDEHDADGTIRVPVLWATLFVYEHRDLIAKQVPEIASELGKIVNWIENGDPGLDE